MKYLFKIFIILLAVGLLIDLYFVYLWVGIEGVVVGVLISPLIIVIMPFATIILFGNILPLIIFVITISAMAIYGIMGLSIKRKLKSINVGRKKSK